MDMTARETAALIGQTRKLNHKGMQFEVEVVDIRKAWGRNDAQVKPIAGSGSTWVDITSLTS
jgi:hypothetical protein